MDTRYLNRSLRLGTTWITPGAQEVLDSLDVIEALRRHASGDWGHCCLADAQANDAALEEGFRVMSVYQDRHQTTFWIITEGDRTATTVLLPEEY